MTYWVDWGAVDNDRKTAKILLTGATGNLGSHLLRVLGNAHQVVPIGRTQWGELDNLAQGVEVLIQAAGDVHATAEANPKRLVGANCTLTAELLEVAARARVPWFYYVSSSAVYGDAPRTSEDVRLHPLTINGITKQLNEALVASFCRANGIRYRIFRVFNMYGGSDRYSIIHRLVSCAREGTTFPLLGEGMMRRDFIHVLDVARAIAAHVGNHSEINVVNVGTGRGVSVAELVATVSSLVPGFSVHNRAGPVFDSVAEVGYLNMVIDTAQFLRVEDQLAAALALTEAGARP
jgi:nucleoside-diphosphate-sugar epimerase